jgi:tripartite-type tricarboxylate transporter receptor subunit TctC
MSLRRLIGAVALGCSGLFFAGSAPAQQFPSKPITLFVGYGAGGTTDAIARMYAAKLQELLKTPVVVENRPGASELQAVRPLIAASPDGHALYLGTGSALAQGPAIRKDLNYDPLANFSPVAMVAVGEAIVGVRPEVPVKSLAELIRYAKSNPGKLSYGSGGVGSGNHLLSEFMLLATGASIVHIPYKSDLESTRDLVGGNVDLLMTSPLTILPFVREGKIRAIAVTGPQRLKALPDVPTVTESGVPELSTMGSYTFFGLVGPAGMPAPIVQQINEAINKIAVMPDVAQSMREKFQLEPATLPAAALRQHMEKEMAKWREAGKNIKVGTN